MNQHLTEKIRSRVLSVIDRFPELKMIYLFGSQVEGNLGPMSDYDFALLLSKDAKGPEVRSRFGSILARELDTRRVDVVLLNEAPIDLAFYIISHGEILFELDVETRVEYEAYIMSLFFDYLPFLRAANQDIIDGENQDVRIQRYRKAFGRTQRTLGQIGAAKGKASG